MDRSRRGVEDVRASIRGATVDAHARGISQRSTQDQSLGLPGALQASRTTVTGSQLNSSTIHDKTNEPAFFSLR